jgi:hypothetical protein
MQLQLDAIRKRASPASRLEPVSPLMKIEGMKHLILWLEVFFSIQMTTAERDKDCCSIQ